MCHSVCGGERETGQDGDSYLAFHFFADASPVLEENARI